MNIGKSEYYPICILHLIDGLFSHGGTPIKLLNLVKYKDERRISHVFLVFADSKVSLRQELIKAGAIVAKVDRHRNWDLRLLLDIISAVRRYNVSIISTNFARADVYGAIAGMLTRTPVIKNVHGMLWNRTRWLQRIDGALSRFRASTVCNSNATCNAVIRQTGAKNTIVIHDGVPNRAVSLSNEERVRVKNSLGIPQYAFVVGHVGGLIPLRDQHLIISGLKRLRDNSVNTYLVFVGDGPLREALETQASRLNITKSVLFLGYRDDVPKLLAAFDVYVNMAREEGFGIAIVEAMQAGLPVVLANAGALPELVEDGVSGILVPPGDAGSLANALKRLAKDSKYAGQLGEKAKNRAWSKFAISRYVSDMENLYLEIASSRHDSG